MSLSFLFGIVVLFSVVYLQTHPQNSISKPTPTPTSRITNLRQTDGLTNFLFLGIGGHGHQAPDLTDTIILISYNHQTHHFNTLPIPRDVWVDQYQAKINTFYHYALQHNAPNALETTKEMFSKTLNVPIHYLAILDFQGFINLIDLVGGVDIEVKRSFDDYKYPIPGKETAEPESARYEHLHFEAGLQHMDGNLALKFARSRHALGPEGSDFARSQRQEQVIRAFLKKLFSSSILLNPTKLNQLRLQLQDSLITDISAQDLPALLKLALSLKQDQNNLKSYSLVPLLRQPSNFSPYGGQWVLIPKSNWQAIYDYVQQITHQ